jgi:flagellar motor switch protein FliN/FliY
MADLREILAQTATAMATALGGLTGDTVAAELADLQGGKSAELGAAAGEAGVTIALTASGPLAGAMLLWLPEPSAKLIAGALAGEEASPAELSDLHVSALGELGKLTAEALGAGLAGAAAGSQAATGEPERVAAGGLAAGLAGLGEEVNYGVINVTAKGAAAPIHLYLAADLAAAISTATAAPVEQAAAPQAADDFQPGLASQDGAADGPAEVNPVSLAEAETGQVLDMEQGLELLGEVNVRITVELGRTSKYVREVLNFAPGSIIELDKLEGEPVDVYVNGMLFARGEIVTIDDSFAVRITEIMSKESRYGSLQGAV